MNIDYLDLSLIAERSMMKTIRKVLMNALSVVRYMFKTADMLWVHGYCIWYLIAWYYAFIGQILKITFMEKKDLFQMNRVRKHCTYEFSGWCNSDHFPGWQLWSCTQEISRRGDWPAKKKREIFYGPRQSWCICVNLRIRCQKAKHCK